MTDAISTKIQATSTADLLQSLSGKKDDNKGPAFDEVLNKELSSQELAKVDPKVENKIIEKPILKFSNHALDRMSSRNIHFTADQITKIEQGMMRANQKGAKEALVVTDDSAMIVSLKK